MVSSLFVESNFVPFVGREKIPDLHIAALCSDCAEETCV